MGGSKRVSHLLIVAVVAAASIDSTAQTRPRRVLTPGTTAPAGPVSAPTGAVELDGDLVQVPVVVSDRAGHYVPGLQPRDFRVFEDGVPQKITNFIPERVPFHVAILIDRSASTRDTIGEIQDAAIALIDQLGPNDEAIVVAFSDNAVVKMTRGFTNDKRLLADAVRDTYATGVTRLYDSVYATITRCLAGVDGRKAMVILSDGDDTASEAVTPEQAIEAFRESDVVVYGVRYPESTGLLPSVTTIYDPTFDPYAISQPAPAPSSQWPPRRGGLRMRATDEDPFMEELAQNTGGTIFYADTVTDMAGLCERIAEELRHVYTLGYQPSNPMRNGGYRQIAVGVPSFPSAEVRYRLGYAP